MDSFRKDCRAFLPKIMYNKTVYILTEGRHKGNE